MSTDFWIEDEFDDDDTSADYGKGDKISCLFPGRCMMPEDHFESECATAEMMAEIEEIEEEQRLAQAICKHEVIDQYGRCMACGWDFRSAALAATENK